jgi:hypothetical protein
VDDPPLPLPLADAVIFLIAFLELNDEDVLSDPDNVVKALESANFELQQLTREQQEALSQRAEQLADQAERNHRDPKTVAFLRSFGEAEGLLDEND